MLQHIESVSVRATGQDEQELKYYDNTKLQAINTCPTWGIVRYSLHKTLTEHRGRNMPLEMGAAAHDVFAAVRLWQLGAYDGLPNLAREHSYYLFGEERSEAAYAAADAKQGEQEKAHAYCLSILDSSGFYDDPADRRRTFTNLELACIKYINLWDWKRQPVWVRDKQVGVELPIDVVIEFLTKEGQQVLVRFVGRVDGLHTTRDGELVLHENKTASRLDDAWRMSFALASQITGYMLTLPVALGINQPIVRGDVFGMSVPLPVNYDFGGIVREPVMRKEHHFQHWLAWVLHTVQLERQYVDDPIHAPKYTHSCNRYFRPCSLIPFCDAEDEERREMLEQMPTDVWSPLDEER